jgi:aminoglycoside N3'-acetyltransferase
LVGLTLGADAPVDDFGLVDDKAKGIGRVKAGGMTHRAVNIDGVVTSSTNQMMVVVADSRFVQRGSSGGFDSAEDTGGNQCVQVVVDRLARDSRGTRPCRCNDKLGVAVFTHRRGDVVDRHTWLGDPHSCVFQPLFDVAAHLLRIPGFIWTMSRNGLAGDSVIKQLSVAIAYFLRGMPSLTKLIEEFLNRDNPVLMQGVVPPQYSETAIDMVNFVLSKRPKAVNYFPSFSRLSETFDVSTTSILNGDISEAAFEVLGPSARTLHPTHSWIVTGRSAAFMIPGNLYAMSPSGMGSPMPEITNFSSLEFLVGVDFMQSTVIETAEESARVPYALRQSQTSVSIVTADGATKQNLFQLREELAYVRNREKVHDLLIREDAMIEFEWGFLVHTRIAHDRLKRELDQKSDWLVSD